MSTYERKQAVMDPRIPAGYWIDFHEIRGYDSPDKWFVAHGPDGWEKEFGERLQAICACEERAELTKELVPDEGGEMPCYLCRGVVDRSMNGKPCGVCEDKHVVTVEQMAQTHDGRVRLAAIAGPMLKDGAWPKWMKFISMQSREKVETFAKNPCKRCGTWVLEPGWVGSAYCSRRCCVDDHPYDPGYAKMILDGYTAELEQRREDAMLAMENPSS